MIKSKNKLITALIFVCALFALCLGGFALINNSTTTAFADTNVTWYFNRGEELTDNTRTVSYSEEWIDDVEAMVGGQRFMYSTGTDNKIIVENAAGQSVTTVYNVGVYTFYHADYPNEKLTFTVAPRQINFADSNTFQWVTDPESIALSSGTVHVYTYQKNGQTQRYYSMNAIEAPDSTYVNWQLENAPPVVASVYGFNYEGAVHKIKPYIPASTLASNMYNIEIPNPQTLSATTTGEYTTVVNITLTDNVNYRFIYDTAIASYIPNRGMTVDINSGTGAITITQVWYVARFDNALLNYAATKDAGSEVAYTFTSWQFGNFPLEGVPYPVLRAGDEKIAGVSQANNYMLTVGTEYLMGGANAAWNESRSDIADWVNGTNDLVTFTLKRGGETIVENASRAKWNYYINSYTPAGDYTVEFVIKTLSLQYQKPFWNTAGAANLYRLEYLGFTRSFSFTVSAGNYNLTDEANEFGNTNAKSYEVDIATLKTDDYSAFFNVIEGKITTSSYVSGEAVKASGTYWAEDEAFATYFNMAPELVFQLGDTAGETYLPASGDWSAYLNKAGTYRVFYKVNMANYTEYPASTALRETYFTVVLFEEIDLPQLQTWELIYTGAEQTVRLRENTHYYISQGSSGTAAGDYTAVITIRDPEHYRWPGIYAGQSSYSLNYKIVKAPVALPAIPEAAFTGKPVKAEITIAQDVNGNAVFEVVYPEANADGFIEMGEYEIKLKLLDTDNYYWTDAEGNAISAVDEDGSVTTLFKIGSAQGPSTLMIVGLSIELALILVLTGTLTYILVRRNQKKKSEAAASQEGENGKESETEGKN